MSALQTYKKKAKALEEENAQLQQELEKAREALTRSESKVVALLALSLTEIGEPHLEASNLLREKHPDLYKTLKSETGHAYLAVLRAQR